jgi:hypothetical protein
MISKESFVKIMDSLRDYSDVLDIMYDKCGINMDDNAFTKMLDNTIDALVEDVEPNFDCRVQDAPWCYYYAFDCDWGRNEKAVEGAPTFGAERAPLTSASELYDYLMLDNGMCEYLENTTYGGTWIGDEE